jgi:hypothetical protein
MLALKNLREILKLRNGKGKDTVNNEGDFSSKVEV